MRYFIGSNVNLCPGAICVRVKYPLFQCSNYHRARVGRGPPTSLNGPSYLKKIYGSKGGRLRPPYLCGSRGEKYRKIFRNAPKKMLRPILMSATDLGYGKNCVLKKPGKGQSLKKVVRNFGRINEHFWGKMQKDFQKRP